MYTAKRGYRPGDEPVPQYHLTKFLGRGQFGEVWQAKGPGGMQVALKIIDLAEREGLKEFAGLQKVKDIRHANLVEFVACWVKTEDGQVLDEVPADPVAALSPRDSSVEIGGTMLFAEGGSSPSRPVELIVAMSLGSKTLFRRLQEINHGKDQKDWTGIPDDELLKYMEEAAKGIDFLNRQGIIHGDIKPQNLLLVGDSVKVCDFGLAQAVDSLRKTQSGMGTVAYAAPELFEGKPNIQSDQYCLAISYVELHTGSLPFDEPNAFKVIELHRHGKLDLQRLTNSERKVIKRATEIKAERRWPSCSEMVSELRKNLQPERSGKGGILASLFGGGRSTSTEQLPRGEPAPILEEPVEAGSGGKPGSKKGSRGAAPAKPDSGKKKSGPHSALEPRVVRTEHRRGDDTDAIAATMASGDISEPQPEPPPGPSVFRRLLKAALVVCVIGALAVAGYIVWPKPSGASKKVLLECAGRGEFPKAVAVDTEARKLLVTAEYETWLADVRRDWGEPATNPVLQQLNSGKIQASDAIGRLKNADAEPDFVKLVGPVPESVWQAAIQPWIKDFEARVAEGDFKKAADVLTLAQRQLIAERYVQLCEAVRKQWSEPSTNRVLLQLREGTIASRDGYVRLKSADSEESFVKLVGPVPAGVWQAVLEEWMKQFNGLLASDLAKAVEEWRAVNHWDDAPSELISPAQKAGLRSRLQDEWKKQTKFADLVAKDDFRGATEELAKPLAKDLFDETGLSAIRKEIQPKWTVYFDSLIKAPEPEKLTKACQELKDVGKFFDSAEEYSQKATQIRTVWSTGTGELAAKRDWVAAKTLFDSVTEEVVPQPERGKAFGEIRTAFDKAFDENLVPPVDKDKLDTAEQMLAGAERVSLLPQGEINRKRETKWVADFHATAEKGDWPKAIKMLAEAPKYISAETLDAKRRVVAGHERELWDAEFKSLIAGENNDKWEKAKKKLDSAPDRLFSKEERGKRLVVLQTAWENAFQPLLGQDQLAAAGQLLDTAMSIELLLPAEIEKKRGEIEKKRVALRDKWDAEFYSLFDKDKKEKDWAGALKKLEAPPPGVLLATELQERRSKLETACRNVFGPLVKNGLWDDAESMLTRVASLNLFPRPEIETMTRSIAGGRQQVWVADFEKALKGKEWPAAKTMIDTAPRKVIPTEEHAKWLGQIKTEWDKDFYQVATSDPDVAGKNMLALVTKIELFSDSEIKERQDSLDQTNIQMRIKRFRELFSNLLKDRKFQEANDELDKIVARLPSDEVKTKRDDLRGGWLTWIHGNWNGSGQTDQTKDFKSQVDAFLKAFPQSPDANEARLLRARASMHPGTKPGAPRQLSDAAEDLRALKTVALPLDRARLRDALLVLASRNKLDLENFRSDYPEEPKNPADPWKLDSWEVEELKSIEKSGSPIVAIKKALEALNDPQAKPGVVGQLLDALEKHYPPASPGSWPNAEREEDVTLLTSTVPLALRKLAADLADNGQPKYADQFKDLGRAQAWLQAAKAKFSIPEISTALYAVATGRLALRVWEPAKPAQADVQEIQDWDQLSKPHAAGAAVGGNELMAKAWRAECHVALGQSIMSARNSVMLIKDPLLAKQKAYAQYLWCRTLRAAGSTDVVRELNELVPSLEGPEPILKVQDRAAAIAELIVEAAGEQRKQFRPWKLDKIPFNPFAGPSEAEQYARLLKAARKFISDANRQRELQLGLALAEFHGPKPAMEQVWSLTRELLPPRGAGAEPDLVPLLFAGASSFWRQPLLVELPADDPQFKAAIGAAAQLLEKLGEDETATIVKKEDAAALYEALLKPVLDNPGFQKKVDAQKQTGSQLFSDFSGAVARFLDNQQDAEWPPWPKGVPSVYHAIESQATLAIELAPKTKSNSARLADYFAIRGGARTNKPDFDADQVLADTKTALEHEPKLYRASVVRCYAFIKRAEHQLDRERVLQDLKEAVAAGEKAVGDRPVNDSEASALLNLGHAYLLLGNYEADPKARQDYLAQARSYASKAEKAIHAYDYRARLLLGNIYEDLASIVGETPKENYREAKKWFEEALTQSPLSAQARSSLARCILKALNRSRLAPQDIGLIGDRSAALKKCADDLENVVGRPAVHDTIRMEAFSYLGQIYLERRDWTKADENVSKAADLAKQSGSATQAAYVSGWASLPLHRANALRRDDPEIPHLLNEAEKRAQELEKIPAGPYTSPVKKAAVILGSVWERRGDYVKAVDAYSRALPQVVSAANTLDVPLLLARAECNLKKMEAATPREVIQDASRALELAPTPREQANAHFCLAAARFLLFQQGGKDAIDNRNGSLVSMREAVRLVEGDNAVRYRYEGAQLIVRIVLHWAAEAKKDPASAFDPKVTGPYLDEAVQWLKQAHSRTQDAAWKTAISNLITEIEDSRK